jgi:hypothetical protein
MAVPLPVAAAPSSVQMPFPCGETWYAWSYAGHSPSSYAVDWNLLGDDSGRSVRAGVSGTAAVIPDNGAYGNTVNINAGDGWTYRYAHLSSFSIVDGATVTAQTEIGRVGNTGGDYGSHLHYEQRYQNQVQPVTFSGTPISYSQTWPGYAYTSANCGTSEVPPPADTDSDGVTDAAPDWCIHDKGTVTNRGCPNSIHQLSGDFNGDGKGDAVSVSRGMNNEPGLAWFRSLSSTTTTSLDNPASFSVVLPAPAWNVDGLKWAGGDFNGDNKSDLLVVSGTPTSGPNMYLLLSDGGQFGHPQLVASPNPAYWQWGLLDFFAGDFDGDGKDDVIYSSRGPNGDPGLGWFRSTSSGATASLASPIGFSVALPAPWWNTHRLKWTVGDFNGDSKDDLAVVSGSQADGPAMYILTSNGTQLANPVNVAAPNPTYWKWDRLVFMAANIDGDSRDDIVYISRGPNNDPGIGWFPSTSTATTTSVASPLSFSVVLPAPAWNMSGLKWAIFDADGDGKDDIFTVSGAGYSGIALYLLTSTGSQVANPVNVGSPNPAYWQWARLQF